MRASINEIVAKTIYEDRESDRWDRLHESRKEPWRQDAARVLTMLSDLGLLSDKAENL